MADADPSSQLKAAQEAVERIVKSLSQDQLDRIVDKVALQTEASLKQNTPKHWFGQVRAGWTTTKPEAGTRVISNAVRASNGVSIMFLLEYGTANGGAGFIYPKRAKKLYVPLTKRAAGGWHPGLQYGRDYILKEKVRGIAPRKIVETEREKIPARFQKATAEMVTSVLKAEGFIK